MDKWQLTNINKAKLIGGRDQGLTIAELSAIFKISSDDFFENDSVQYGVLQLMSYTSFFTQIVIMYLEGHARLPSTH